MFDFGLYKSLILNDGSHHASRSESDSEHFYHEPRSSKTHSFIKFHEIFDLPNTDSVTTLLRRSPTNQLFLCILPNRKPPVDLPSKIFNHYREKFFAFLSITFHSAGQTIIFTKLKLNGVALPNIKESFTVVYFMFIIESYSCILTLRLYFLGWKELEHTEVEEFSLKTETEQFGTTTTVVQ